MTELNITAEPIVLLDAEEFCESRGWVQANVSEDAARDLLAPSCYDEDGDTPARPNGPASRVWLKARTETDWRHCTPDEPGAVEFFEFDTTDTVYLGRKLTAQGLPADISETLRDIEWARSISPGGPDMQSREWTDMRVAAIWPPLRSHAIEIIAAGIAATAKPGDVAVMTVSEPHTVSIVAAELPPTSEFARVIATGLPAEVAAELTEQINRNL
jgi:hypothetical protein